MKIKAKNSKIASMKLCVPVDGAEVSFKDSVCEKTELMIWQNLK